MFTFYRDFHRNTIRENEGNPDLRVLLYLFLYHDHHVASCGLVFREMGKVGNIAETLYGNFCKIVAKVLDKGKLCAIICNSVARICNTVALSDYLKLFIGGMKK